MTRVELTEEIIRRIVGAALQGQAVSPYRMCLARQAAEQIVREQVEAEFAELENHFLNEALS